MQKTRFQLELIMSIVVANELEGLKSSKKEKTARAAEEALSYVKANNIRLLGVNGKLLAGELYFSTGFFHV